VLRDFAPVTLVARTAQTLVARSGFSAGSLEEVIALSMQPDADVRYGTAGVGTPGHLVMELLNAMSGSRLRHVPYRGGAPALTDVLGGHVDLVSTGLPALIGQIRSGALVPLAVSPLTRTPVLPGVPTFAELIPGVFFDTWYGFLAPAGTPAAVTAGLHADIAAVMKTPEMAAKLGEMGFEIYDLGPDELGELMRADLPRLTRIVALSGIAR
jgi:tripartite-type tricarboxylate transporter receptor subunit TctC